MISDESRIVVVTGKGGVGKTTVTAALGLRAASKGKRVLLVEAAGAERIPALFGLKGRSYQARRCTENLYTLSITPEEAIEDYVVLRIKIRALYKLVFRNRIMDPFINAVPGLHDVVHLGKLSHLEESQKNGRPEWDLIVFDAPATGHGLTMLASPQSLMSMTRAGPFYENTAIVEKALSDPRKTRLVLVATSDEMVINETLDLYERLGERREQVDGIVLNECMPAAVDPDLWKASRDRFSGLSELTALADAACKRTLDQQSGDDRLHIQSGQPIYRLPFLINRQLSISDLELLGDSLDGSQ
jgi:anion-transporting  ArsA/GET3 family ATPase